MPCTPTITTFHAVAEYLNYPVNNPASLPTLIYFPHCWYSVWPLFHFCFVVCILYTMWVPSHPPWCVYVCVSACMCVLVRVCVWGCECVYFTGATTCAMLWPQMRNSNRAKTNGEFLSSSPHHKVQVITAEASWHYGTWHLRLHFLSMVQFCFLFHFFFYFVVQLKCVCVFVCFIFTVMTFLERKRVFNSFH